MGTPQVESFTIAHPVTFRISYVAVSHGVVLSGVVMIFTDTPAIIPLEGKFESHTFVRFTFNHIMSKIGTRFVTLSI